MIKLVLWGVRKPETLHADYYQGNHVAHGDLVRGAPEDFRTSIKRYTQSYVFDAAYGDPSLQHIDSVSELWYESVEAAAASFAHPYYQQVVQPDGARFADESRNIVHFATEDVLGRPVLRGQGIKVHLSLTGAAGTAPQDLAAFLDAVYNESGSGLDHLLGRARSSLLPGAPVLSGIPPTVYESYWLDGEADIPSFQRYARVVLDRGQHAGVLVRHDSFYLLCRERRVLDSIEP